RPGTREPFFMAAVTLIMLSFAARTLLAAMGSLWTSPRGTQRLVAMPFVLLSAVAIAYAQAPAQAHSLRGDLPCVLMTLAIGGIVGAAVFVARRATEPLRPTLNGLLLASFSAAVAGAAVFLACPLAETWHFAIGHVGGAILLGGLLGAIGARVMRA
ncbi:MAG TPA: NrsF family protein, partial [Myxococcota bacterium]|nr:NrsF family protein [Myxococcota bacterium]